ncbi:hypothetical protein GCM10008955_04700 [Deinococcus malanensis]|uniref:SWIM-type domain-containing protein n=1 Tax=Deinococcus malanensis TaxID=1706855 RepID=A0ABQ2EJG2_9DEIO|nr:hypothetical protein GCM10008955_04700 [Deinococcus malanensis]
MPLYAKSHITVSWSDQPSVGGQETCDCGGFEFPEPRCRPLHTLTKDATFTALHTAGFRSALQQSGWVPSDFKLLPSQLPEAV